MPERNHGTVTIGESRFNGDIVITDPCYLIPDDRPADWEACAHGDEMEALGIAHYLCRVTLYGDWSCEVFKGTGSRLWYPQAPEKKIGEFAADACRVGVFYLREILRYNPAFDFHINKPWCACLIKGFRGSVKIVTKVDPDGDESMHLIGIGSKSFFTRESYWSEVLAYKQRSKKKIRAEM